MKTIPLYTLPVALLAATPALAVTCQNGIAPSNPDAVYVDHGDGTVTDTRTGLMWDQCTWGQSGAACSSAPATTQTWGAALALAATANAMNGGTGYKGHADWRLPNLKELESLTEECRISPVINDSLFPNTPSAYFWSDSPSARDSDSAWYVRFSDGYAGYDNRSSELHVRLVRGGQSLATYDTAGSDDDGDGQNDAAENDGPNQILGQSDGNGDGVPDSVQTQVATLLRADSSGQYVTVATDCPAGLTGVRALSEASQGGGDAEFDLPYGTVGFSAACETAQFTVYYHGVTSVAGMTYRKYGPIQPGNGAAAWYTLPGVTFGTASVGGQTVATATFTLTDNALGDDTGDDGVIVDQGGVGSNANGAGGGTVAVPALGPWALAMLTGLLGWLGFVARRR